jgi:rubredoxin
MKKYVCTVCGFVYDEAKGIPEKGIKPGTTWEELPDDWVCPLCGATKGEFSEQTTDNKAAAKSVVPQDTDGGEMRELSYAELGALCSNLSKGCEKQYRSEEAELFLQLAQYFGSKAAPMKSGQLDALSKLIEEDLSTGYPASNAIAAGQADRGALRALVWGEKVTRILASLLKRYETQKGTLLEATNVYVCEICGFIYIGDEPPEICPVCKVPMMKIRQIQRGIA